MARTSTAEEYPRNSGITIRPIDNATSGKVFGISYQVTVPGKVSGRGRIRKQFPKKNDARLFAERQHKGARQEGEGFFDLNPEERRQIGAMVPKLREREISITYAIQYALDRLPSRPMARTLGEVVEELRRSKEERLERGKLSGHTLRTYKYHTARMVSDIGSNTPVHEITAEQVEAFIKGIEGEDRTRRNYFRTANQVLTYAEQKRYLRKNPVADWAQEDKRRFFGGDEDIEDADIQIFSVKEIEDFLAFTLQTRPDFLPFVVLAAFTGCRTEEIMKLDWSKVDLEAGFITLDASITKKRRKRYVPIPGNAKEWLLTMENRSGPVVAMPPDSFRVTYHRHRLAAGWENKDGKSTWKKNGLRHSFGSYHFALHGDSVETARVMGHRQGDTVLFDHYAALATKDQAKAYFAITPGKVKARKVVSIKEAGA